MQKNPKKHSKNQIRWFYYVISAPDPRCEQKTPKNRIPQFSNLWDALKSMKLWVWDCEYEIMSMKLWVWNCGDKQQQAEPDTLLIEGNLGCLFPGKVIIFEKTPMKDNSRNVADFRGAKVVASDDLSNHCLKCKDKRDNFCHRMLFQAAKYQQRVVYTNWSEWTMCSSVCGSSSRTRTRNYQLEGEGKLCLGPRKENEKCLKPACKSYKFVMEEEVSSSVTKRIGAFEEQSAIRPFRMETKFQVEGKQTSRRRVLVLRHQLRRVESQPRKNRSHIRTSQASS